jgi:hypothetical protein
MTLALGADGDFLKGKEARFQGTAELVEMLKLYCAPPAPPTPDAPHGHVHARTVQKPTFGPTPSFAKDGLLLERICVEHLTQLQMSADNFEAHGKDDRAQEIRDVSTEFRKMLNFARTMARSKIGQSGTGTGPDGVGS